MINGKALYTPKGAALEYGRVGCNFYTGCPHDCVYCYLKRGAPSKQLGGKEVRLKKCFKDKEDAHLVLCKELDKWQAECKEHGIFLSFTTDPLIGETRDLTLTAIIEANLRKIPVWLLTKTDAFLHDDEFMAWMENFNALYRYRIHFGFTFTGRDDMEKKASPNEARVAALRRMKKYGYSTWASIEPVIDWESSCHMIESLLGVCDHFKVGLRSGVGVRDYYDSLQTITSVNWLTTVIPNHGGTVYLKQSIRKYMTDVLRLSPSQYGEIMSRTVETDGKAWKPNKN